MGLKSIKLLEKTPKRTLDFFFIVYKDFGEKNGFSLCAIREPILAV
jgi:hypothetical protein